MNQIYVSTSGGTVSGTKSTNAARRNGARQGAGCEAAPAPSTTTAQIASDTARNQANNALANTGHGATSTGAAVSTSQETMVPLSAFAHFGPGNTPLAVNHQNLFVAVDDLVQSRAGRLAQPGDGGDRRSDAPARRAGVDPRQLSGHGQVFQQSLDNEPVLIAAALLAVYIVLGVLYESYVHPITILSTLPSAGVGAVLALIATGTEFSIMALIGVILLIGIVKKNAIMMIDFALDAERSLGLSSREAIYQACLKRFRPIMMTTMAAMLGALPLAIGFGEGSELRRPLGISIVGGLIVSQLLTLYTTPVIYLYLDRFRLWGGRRWRIRHPRFCLGPYPRTGGMRAS